MRRLSGLILAAACSASAAGGVLDGPRQQMLGARAAAMGGFDVTGNGGAESVVGNPASLPDNGLRLGAFSGLGPSQQGLAAFGLSLPVDEGLRLGLLYGGGQDGSLAALRTQDLALSAAMTLQPGSSVGLRAEMQQLQADGLDNVVRGGSLDLGWQAQALKAPWIPGLWSLGLGADHVAGVWPDAAWAQASPMTGRVGLSYRPIGSLSLGVQQDWIAAPGVDGAMVWAIHSGLQWSAIGALALRAGWSDNGQTGRISAGAGYELSGPGLGLDYALVAATGGGALSHRLSLQWAWAMQPHSEMRVRLKQLLREPESGIVRKAQFDLTLSPLLRQEAWRVELRDGEGKVWRTLTPQDRQDELLAWDGRDEQGRSRPMPEDLRAYLVALGPKGPLVQASPTTLLESAKELELAQAEAALPAAGPLPAPTIKPVFEDAKGTVLSHVLIEMPATKAQSWSVDINDDRDRRLRRLAGQGDLPAKLVWDGRDDQGRKVADALGLQMRLRVVDAKGVQAVQQQALFSQQAFALAHQQARQRPELRLASLGLPLMLGRPALSWMDGFLPPLLRGAQRRLGALAAAQRSEAALERRRRYLREDGSSVDVDLFDVDGSAVLEQRLDLMQPVTQRLQSLDPGREKTLWVTGLAMKDEAEPGALARRRAEAMARLLRKQGAGVQVVLESTGLTGDRKGVRLELR